MSLSKLTFSVRSLKTKATSSPNHPAEPPSEAFFPQGLEYPLSSRGCKRLSPSWVSSTSTGHLAQEDSCSWKGYGSCVQLTLACMCTSCVSFLQHQAQVGAHETGRINYPMMLIFLWMVSRFASASSSCLAHALPQYLCFYNAKISGLLFEKVAKWKILILPHHLPCNPLGALLLERFSFRPLFKRIFIIVKHT